MLYGLRSLQLSAFDKTIEFELHWRASTRWFGCAFEIHANVEVQRWSGKGFCQQRCCETRWLRHSVSVEGEDAFLVCQLNIRWQQRSDGFLKLFWIIRQDFVRLKRNFDFMLLYSSMHKYILLIIYLATLEINSGLVKMSWL